MLVRQQIHHLHRKEEQNSGQHRGHDHPYHGGHAHSPADAPHILFAPILAGQNAKAALHTEDDGDQQKYRYIGSRYRGHLGVAQLADHEGVDESQRKGDEVLQHDGHAQPQQPAVKAGLPANENGHNCSLIYSMAQRCAW